MLRGIAKKGNVVWQRRVCAKLNTNYATRGIARDTGRFRLFWPFLRALLHWRVWGSSSNGTGLLGKDIIPHRLADWDHEAGAVRHGQRGPAA